MFNSQAPGVPELARQGIFRWKNIPFILTFRILWKYCQYYRMNVECFSGLKTAFDVDRYQFGVLSFCENVRENLEEIWPFVPDLAHRAPGAYVVSGAWEWS